MERGLKTQIIGKKLLSLGALLAAVALLSGCTSIKEHAAIKEGAQLYHAGNYKEAAVEFEKATSLNQERPTNFKHLGYCYWNLIEPGSTLEKDKVLTDKALENFRKYLESDPEDSEKIQDYLINLYLNQQRLDDGIQFYEKVLRQNPKDSRILQTLALMYGRKGEFKKSLEYSYAKADVTPDDPSGYLFIGALCWNRSYNREDEPEDRALIVEKGMTALESALKLDPMSFEGLLYTNLLYRQKADLAKIAAEDAPDRASRKEFQDQAQEYLDKADEFREQAIAARKKGKEEGSGAEAPPTPDEPVEDEEPEEEAG